MPHELVTTASSASMRPVYRAAGWTVYAFIGVAGALVWYAIILFAWVVVGKGVGLPNTTGFPDIDIVAKNVMAAGERDAEAARKSLSHMLRQVGLDEGGSRNVVREMKSVRLYMGERDEGK
jgi:hypothetical protein